LQSSTIKLKFISLLLFFRIVDRT